MKIYVVAGVILLAFAVSAVITAQGQQPVLVNGDFEGGFSIRESPEVQVANGWDYAYIAGNDRWCSSSCGRPEAKPEQQIVSQGAFSQRWFSTFRVHLWTIHQEVKVEHGQWYTFECDVQARTSTPPGDLGVFVGINPWGAGVFDRTMVWGKESVGDSGWIYNKWVHVSVTTQAFGDKIRVAVGSNPRWAVRENTAYVDNCTIRKVSVGPTPEPCPTCTPSGTCDYERIKSDMATVIAEWDRR